MEQIYPLAGTTTTSCASQDFDFLNYWVDKTVEKEILRGKKLQELKQQPKIRNTQYDVINIDINTNVYNKKKRSKRRSKSPKKRGRKNSPQCKTSPTRILPKKESKSGRHRCSLRTAELSVPSKRQCIDTWRTKYHVLPGIMIDRLRQHVLDLSPVVKIPDAVECFKRHKKIEKRKNKEAKKKKIKEEIEKCDNTDYDNKIKKKPTKVQKCRYICAIFGHKIAKLLNKSMEITLNPELQKISNVVSIELEKLISKGKRVDNRNIKNKKVQAEVSDKIAIWISSILNETEYKLLEDQLRDLEEDVGPVLDFIDELVDNVVDVCEPEPEIIELSSSSETYNIESSTDDEGHEETIEDQSVEVPSVEIDFPPETEPVELNLDDYIKNELDHIINSFDGDIVSDVEDINLTDVENQTLKNKTEYQDVEDQIQLDISPEFETDKDQSEFVDANDTFEVPLPEHDTRADIEIPHAETKDDISITGGETEADRTKDLPSDLLSEDDSNKKVKFSDVTNTTEQLISEYFNPDKLYEPNDNLLSDADESWPGDMTLPILRPSESVSKSITSLGNIMEAEERMSIILDDATDNNPNINMDTTTDETKENINHIRKDSAIFNDTTTDINAKTNDAININDNSQLHGANDDKNESLTNIVLINDNGTIQDHSENVIDRNTDTTIVQNERIKDDKSETEPTAYTKEQQTEKDEQPHIKGQDIERDNTKIAEQFTGEDGQLYTKDQLIEKYGEERNNELILKSKIAYAEREVIDMDSTHPTDKYTGDDGKTYTKEELIEKYGKERSNEIIEKSGKTYTERQDIDKESTNKYTDDDGKTYTKEQLVEKYGNKVAEQMIEKDVRNIREELSHLAADDGIHRPSTDSVFHHDIPTETVTYEPKLDKILEEQATQVPLLDDNLLKDKAIQVGLTDEIKVNSKKAEYETADKEINTSFSLVRRADKSTSVVSQSLGDLTKRIQGAKAYDMFSSLRIKPKVDYKVHKNSAPSWVTRNFGEPADSIYTTPQYQKKSSNDKNIRLWCKDLENGFDNLELWNSWIENTVESVKVMEIKKAKICIVKSREGIARDWLHLKKNVDADVSTWTKLSKSTREKLKGFRKICQNFEAPSTDKNKICNNCNT